MDDCDLLGRIAGSCEGFIIEHIILQKREKKDQVFVMHQTAPLVAITIFLVDISKCGFVKMWHAHYGDLC